MILEHSERHLAYPVLHYFHSTEPKYSGPLTLTMLDEAISIQQTYKIDNSPHAINWKILRETMDSFTEVLDSLNSFSKDTEPPFISQDEISFLPVNNSHEKIKNSVASLAERRMKLHGMIMRDGWNWEDVN